MLNSIHLHKMAVNYPKLKQAQIDELNSMIGAGTIVNDEDTINAYSSDETEDLKFCPDAVAFPSKTEHVSKILKYCSAHSIPVTAAGARTGLSGGSLPVAGGIALSTARMNRIIRIDRENLQVWAEPGVITQVLQETVAEAGLYYPPDPSSRGSCTIGGNIAENAGGPHAVKYGVTKDFVLNLEVVLASGEVIWTGANTLKNSTGYNLTQLMVGSEGTLGVVTCAVLKLIPDPGQNVLMLAPFNSAENACKAVSAIFMAGVIPSALEFMERDAILWTMQFIDDLTLSVDDDVQAHLLIEVDGHHPDVLLRDCEKITEVLGGFDCGEILFADTESQKNQLWKLRRKVGEAVKSHSVYKEEDTVVPRYQLATLLSGVKSIGAKYGFKSVCYGHAGDGNLHVNIIKGAMDDNKWTTELPLAIREIFQLTKSLGGTLSGEHGIGLVQRDYMDIVFSRTEIDLMYNIKKVFDPEGILNPHKLFPSRTNSNQ